MRFLLFYFLLHSLVFANYEDTVNYVWMGDLNTPNREALASVGPKRLAELLNLNNMPENIIVNFWVRPAALEAAQKLFSDIPRILVKSFDDYMKSDQVKYFTRDKVERIMRVIDKLEETKSHAMQADWVGLVVVAEMGGYYFDTTTFFKTWPELFNNNWEKRIGIAPSGSDIEQIKLSGNPLDGVDLQVFAAPQKGDLLFVNAVDYALEDFKSDVVPIGSRLMVPHNALRRAAEEIYEQQMANLKDGRMWNFLWLSKLWYGLIDYYELELIKIPAGTWRNDKTGNNSSYVSDSIQIFNALESIRYFEDEYKGKK